MRVKKMINLNLEIPEPSKFVSFKKVDSVALELSKAYRSESKNNQGYPIDCERFVDWLELSLYSDEFDEPAGASFFAGLTLADGGTVCINEKHRSFFDERPDVYLICLGHEIGHAVLGHLNHSSINDDLPLFSKCSKTEPIMLHSSSWFQYGLPKKEVEKRKAISKKMRDDLVSTAAINTQDRQLLKQLDEKFEPEWMFKQAEHFAKCLCIPQDRLYEVLEIIPLMKGWNSIYKLAEAFGISASVMRSRLLYLNLIEMDGNNQPVPTLTNTQNVLF